jgi:[ribosomal protein S18]-alanine N-acetyltransferase
MIGAVPGSGEIKLRAVMGAEALGLVEALMELSAELAEAPHWTQEIWRTAVAGERELLVAETDGALVGFVLYTRVAGEAEIESIAVRERFQRRGVGGALMEATLKRLKMKGFEQVHLELRAGNGKAHGFYTARGFEEVGRRAGYYADPVEDALLLSLKVEPEIG